MSRASVLLPFRDAARTLGEALDTLLVEDADFEVVAIDDGSSDEGAQIVEARARRDARVRLVRTAPLGLVPALERARREARGDILIRMDADDRHLGPRVAASVAAFDEDPSLGLVGTRTRLLSDETIGVGLERYVAWQNEVLTAEEHARELFVESPICHPTFAIRSACLEALGGYRDGPFPEDYDLLLRVHRAGLAMRKLPLVGLEWRHASGRLTFRDPRYATDAFRRLKVEHLLGLLAPRLAPEGASPARLVVWGAGRDGRRFLRELLARGVVVDSVVDIAPAKIGRTIYGLPIIAPDALPSPDVTFVVVSVGTRGARGLIRADLDARGFVELRDYRCVA